MHALSIAAFVLLSTQSVVGYVVPRKATPSTYAEGYLEPYQTYHTRYLALGCQHQHNNASFFNACCHPMLATETLATARPSYCNPSNSASSSASAPEATSDNSDDSDDDDCDDGDEGDSSSSAPTPTSTPESPSDTPSSTPNPTPTSTDNSTPTSTDNPTPTTSSSSDATPTGSPDSSNGSSEVFTGGHATFFKQNGVAGACGDVHSDSDFIVALDQQRYGNPSEKSQYCGRTVAITGLGKTVNAVVADDCPTCDNENCLDMSVGLFQQFTEDLGVGEFDITWQFV